MGHQQEPGLQRTLKNRHLQLIAIGGCIGTGLFLGAGKTISLAGPSILLAYIVIGFFLFFVMRAMGELLLSNLEYKSFVDFVHDILGPRAGFFVGWSYWFCWVVIGIADIVAITGYVQFWWEEVPLWLPGMLTIAALLCLNLLTVKLFGELEFWFALIKIVAIMALILVGGYLLFVGFESPNGHKAALSNLWTDSGFMPNGWGGFFAAFQMAIFAFVGVELVGTTSAETENPEKTLPSAINKIPMRIIVFYVLALGVIMTVTPWSAVSPDKSPFVNMFSLIGITAAAGIINFVVLSSAMSSANSGMYSTGRMLYGLGLSKLAPKAFGKLTKTGVPGNGLLYSCALLVVGVVLLYVDGNVMRVFTIVTTISSICFLFVWTMILFSYIKYRKTRADLHEKSIYKMPLGVPMCWVIMAFFAFVIYLCALDPDTLVGLKATPIWFLALAISYLFYQKNLPEHNAGN